MREVTNLTCEICGLEFYNSRSTTRFCSKKCANRSWYLTNRDRRLEKNKKFRTDNPEYAKRHFEQWRRDNPNYFTAYCRSNTDRIAERKRDRYNKDLNYKINCTLRDRLYNAIKNDRKAGSAVGDLGCSIEYLKNHLESQFQPGMSWENHGEWHIDHIVPLSYFFLHRRRELQVACHYTNLQPLWARDNLVKNDSVRCEITIVAGVSGAGKTTLADELSSRYLVLEADSTKPHQLAEYLRTSNELIYTMSSGICSFVKRCTGICSTKLVVITEDEDVIEHRLSKRGNYVTDSISRRMAEMSALAKESCYSGTYSEVREFLTKDRLWQEK